MSLEQKVSKVASAITATVIATKAAKGIILSPNQPFRRLYVGFSLDATSAASLFWRVRIDFAQLDTTAGEAPFSLSFSSQQSSDSVDGSITPPVDSAGAAILPPFTVERSPDYTLDYSPSGAPPGRDEMLIQVATSATAGIDLVRMAPIPLFTKCSIASISWWAYTSSGTGNFTGIVGIRSSEVPL